MRTNIDIDDAVLEAAMQAGGFRTKKQAVEAGLKLLARQAHYREILKWRGKLSWQGDESIDWTQPESESGPPATASAKLRNKASAAAASRARGNADAGR